MTTPAQEAKDFAAKNGFKIITNGRRYDVWTDYEGDEHQNHVAEVGGYPAALNAMKRYVEPAQELANAVKLGEAIGKDQLQQSANFNHVALTDNAPNPACKVAPAGWDKVETSVDDFPFEDDASKARIRTAAADFNAGKVNHPFAPAAAPRTGWYVRVTRATGEIINDIFCSSMKEAYRTCAQTANHFRRNGLTPVTKSSVIFKRGA